MTMQIGFSQDTTKYRGQKMKVAVVSMNGRKVTLGLSDTSRCAQGDRGETGQTIAARILRNIAGNQEAEVEGEAAQLQAHCRELLGLKPL